MDDNFDESINIKQFSNLLQQQLARMNLNQVSLAEKLEVSPRTVKKWIAGARPPRIETILHMANILELSAETTNLLLINAGYKPTNMPHAKKGEDKINSLQYQTFPEASSSTGYPFDKELQNRIDNIQTTVETLQNIVAAPNQDNSELLKGIQEELTVLTNNLVKFEAKAKEITAPVRMPKPDAMQVTLVSTTNLERLEEYRHESNKWDTVFGIFIGSVLGLLSNLVTGGKLGFEAWVLIAILGGMSGLTWWTAYKYKERAAKVKNKIDSDGQE